MTTSYKREKMHGINEKFFALLAIAFGFNLRAEKRRKGNVGQTHKYFITLLRCLHFYTLRKPFIESIMAALLWNIPANNFLSTFMSCFVA